jgi:hypothetical protein
MPTRKPKHWYLELPATEPSICTNVGHHGINLRQAIFGWHRTICGRYPVAQCVESITQAPDASKQLGINQRRNGLSVFIDDDAFISVLHLVEHLTEILSKINGTYLFDHVHPRPVGQYDHYGLDRALCLLNISRFAIKRKKAGAFAPAFLLNTG